MRGDLIEPTWTTRPKLVSSLLDMAHQGAPQTAKESNLKGFRNCLKKVFGRSTLPRRSSSPAVVTPLTVVASPPTNLAPTGSTITTDPEEETAKLRAKYTHFRILVIGRANAGKTTLLKRVCNTKEDPGYSKVVYLLCFISTLIIPSPTD